MIFTTLIKDDILFMLKTEKIGVYESRCTLDFKYLKARESLLLEAFF